MKFNGYATRTIDRTPPYYLLRSCFTWGWVGTPQADAWINWVVTSALLHGSSAGWATEHWIPCVPLQFCGIFNGFRCLPLWTPLCLGTAADRGCLVARITQKYRLHEHGVSKVDRGALSSQFWLFSTPIRTRVKGNSKPIQIEMIWSVFIRLNRETDNQSPVMSESRVAWPTHFLFLSLANVPCVATGLYWIFCLVSHR